MFASVLIAKELAASAATNDHNTCSISPELWTTIRFNYTERFKLKHMRPKDD